MQPKLITRRDGQLEFELHQDHPLRLCHAKGRKLEVLAGTIWITAYNQLTDFELVPGQVFVVPSDRLTLVEPIGCGTVRVEPPRRIGDGLSRLLARLRLIRLGKAEPSAACMPASSR